MPDGSIHVPYPDADDLHLQIALGACRFEARPGGEEPWVAGTWYDPTGERAPTFPGESGKVLFTETNLAWERIPAVFGGVPRYEVALGKDKDRPFALTIETGASEFDLDLGGVPLKA